MNGNSGRYPAGSPVVWAGVPDAPGACVVAVAEPGAPAEPAELVPVAGVVVAGAVAAVLPQPQATRLVIAATVNRAVRKC